MIRYPEEVKQDHINYLLRKYMPYKPPRQCRTPACAEVTRHPSGYCDKHEEYRNAVKREYEKHRLSAAIRGYDRTWRKYRKAFLRKNPLCKQCEAEGRITSATVVDHIQDHKGDPDLFWDRSNHQALCKRCHDRKTAEASGFGRKNREGEGGISTTFFA